MPSASGSDTPALTEQFLARFDVHAKAAARRVIVRVPGKALLFGEYGLLAGGGGVALTVPSHFFEVEVSLVAREGEPPGEQDDVAIASVESPFLAGGWLSLRAREWRKACDAAAPESAAPEAAAPDERSLREAVGAVFDLRGDAHDARFFFALLFPYREVIEKACADGLHVQIRVLRSFSPALGLGSSSALLVAVHEGLRAVALSHSATSEADEDFFARAMCSLRIFQGRASGYDVLVQTAAKNTLAARVYWVVPQPAGGVPLCEDITGTVFSSWSRDAERVGSFSLVPSGSYAPTGDILARVKDGDVEKAAATDHAKLAALWREHGCPLWMLGDLCAWSRAIAKRQGLFGAEGTPFAQFCAALESRGHTFKTMGAGLGDSVLVCSPPADSNSNLVPTASPAVAAPVFSLAAELAERLPLSLARLQEKILAARANGALSLQAGDTGFASAPSNIALLKYWGKRAGLLQQPLNASVSAAIGSFRTFTRVTARTGLDPMGCDPACESAPASRVAFVDPAIFAPGAEYATDKSSAVESKFVAPDRKIALFLRRVFAGIAPGFALDVVTANTFPTACGIASSASGFAALSAALADLLGLETIFTPEECELWIAEWARIGSGSATRSCSRTDEGRYVAWDENGTRVLQAATTLENLGHGVVVFSAEEKKVLSSAGHASVHSSPLQPLRLAGVALEAARLEAALASGDFESVAAIAERDAFAMHAVMQTSTPPAWYFAPETSSFISAFVVWRNENSVRALWTLDAGPNVHLLFLQEEAARVRAFVREWKRRLGSACAFLQNSESAGLVRGRDATLSLHARAGARLKAEDLS